MAVCTTPPNIPTILTKLMKIFPVQWREGFPVILELQLLKEPKYTEVPLEIVLMGNVE